MSLVRGAHYFVCIVVFFFKQKTAYEMRISDWSSDVCSSDLARSSRHRNEIAAKEDALHIAEGKKRVCQRRDFCFLWSREIARAGLHDLAAGKEFERRRIGRHFGFYEHEQYLGPIIRGIKGTSGFPGKRSEKRRVGREV